MLAPNIATDQFVGCIAVLCTRRRLTVTDGVAWSVSRSVTNMSPAIDRDAFWVVDLAGSKEPCIRWGSRSPHWKGNPTEKYMEDRPCAAAMRPFVKLLWPLVKFVSASLPL